MSDEQSIQSKIVTHFNICEDPRTRPVQYPLLEIIVIVVLATLCGEEGWEAFADWAKDKTSFLKKILPFTNGIPSPDTLRRVVERLNSEMFLKAFMDWAEDLNSRTQGQVCIDGKSLRSAMYEGGPLHLVTAWSEANQVVLGSIKTPSKSNEIKAIEDLLDVLILKDGDIVTIDAIGCQKSIISKITEQKADYVIALKRNQLNFVDEVDNFFDQVLAAPDYSPSIGVGAWRKGHGRKHKYEVWVSTDISWLPQVDDWNGLRSIIMVIRKWEVDGKELNEKRYYISSLEESPERICHIVRRHWSIENELHWHLDVTFREDQSQIGAIANENLRVARMIALKLLKGEKTFKRGLKSKIRRCLRSDEYLEQVLVSGNF